MYKVFINAVAVYLINKDRWQSIQEQYQNDEAAEFYPEQEDRDLEPLIKLWESVTASKTLLLPAKDVEQLKDHFFSHFKIIRAAGGVVLNNKGEILLIFRKGKWDLPKGKLDRGESLPACAVREVKEETGLTDLQISRPVVFPGLQNDYMMHVYREKGQRYLKKTYWFEMKNRMETELVPEEKEGITKVRWVNPDSLHEYTGNTYLSLLDIFNQYTGRVL